MRRFEGMSSTTSNWWEKPFSVVVDGAPWAVLTDKVFLIAIKGGNKLPPLSSPGQEEKLIAQMIRLGPKAPKPTDKGRLLEVLVTDDYVSILGFPVDSGRLTRVLSKLKKSSTVSLWDASGPMFSFKCLGLVSGEWKAFVMGNRGKWNDLPIYEFEEAPRDVFDEPDLTSSPEEASSQPAPVEEQPPLPDQ